MSSYDLSLGERWVISLSLTSRKLDGLTMGTRVLCFEAASVWWHSQTLNVQSIDGSYLATDQYCE